MTSTRPTWVTIQFTDAQGNTYRVRTLTPEAYVNAIVIETAD